MSAYLRLRADLVSIDLPRSWLSFGGKIYFYAIVVLDYFMIGGSSLAEAVGSRVDILLTPLDAGSTPASLKSGLALPNL